jgi:hypothetical protein
VRSAAASNGDASASVDPPLVANSAIPGRDPIKLRVEKFESNEWVPGANSNLGSRREAEALDLAAEARISDLQSAGEQPRVRKVQDEAGASSGV